MVRQEGQGASRGILLMLAVVTAVFSALLDNVTNVLLIAPITLLICHELDLNPYPFLFAEIFASNMGGTATLIGDPPNIMIASAVHLGYNDFLLNLAPIVPLIMLATLIVIYFVWDRRLHATEDARARIMQFREQDAITDVTLLKQSLTVLALVRGGFVFAHPLQLEPASIAMFGAALLLLLTNFRHGPEKQSENIQQVFSKMEWGTIFFFIGLFVAVKGIEEAGVLKMLADRQSD
jgi:Na+/H+ antiporter NhaD/arsenite permease-like protein